MGNFARFSLIGGFMGYFSNLDIDYQEYLKQYANAPKWELLAIKKALNTFGGFLNSEEDNARLYAVTDILKARKRKNG
jgi:hypothetical protein